LAEVAPEDIFLFVYKKGESRYTDLIKEFVKPHKCAKQTMINYKKQLQAAGKLKKRISEKTGRPVYYVPDEFKEEAENILKKRQLHDYVNNADMEDLEYLRTVYEILQSENKKLKKELEELKERVRAFILLHGT